VPETLVVVLIKLKFGTINGCKTKKTTREEIFFVRNFYVITQFPI
jgi:hypothetical protein